MKKISIAGHGSGNTARKLLETYPKQFDAIIIDAPEKALPSWVPDLSNEYLYLKFWDIAFPYGKLQAPEKHHVQEALDWAKGRDNIMVACHAGVSRSSATAYLIVCQEHGVEEGIKILDPQRHQPNRRIVYFGGEILGKEVWDNYVAWMNEHLHDDVSRFHV